MPPPTKTFLKKAEALVSRMAKKDEGTHPDDPERPSGSHRALQQSRQHRGRPASSARQIRKSKAKLALEIDEAMRQKAPAGWKGDSTREKQVLNALFPLMSRDRAATQAIFEIIKNQPGY